MPSECSQNWGYENWLRSLGQLDELAKPHPQARSQFIGNLDSHANLPKLNGADIGPVDLGLLGKSLLRKTLLLSLLPNGAAKGSP